MSTFTSALLTFSSTAALALPPPYGILASAGLSLLNMFFGTGSNQAAIQQALEAVVNEFEAFSMEEDVAKYSDAIRDATDWLHRAATDLVDIQDADRVGVLTSQLAELDTVAQEGSALRLALEGLDDPRFMDPAASPISSVTSQDQVRDQAFQLLCAGVSAYLMHLRLRVQWQVELSQLQNNGQATIDYGRYDDFRQDTEMWGGRIAEHIDTFVSYRLQQVHAVTTSAESFDIDPNQSADAYQAALLKMFGNSMNAWYFGDVGAPGAPKIVPPQAQQNATGWCLLQDAIDYREQYLQKLASDLDAQYADARNGADAWQAALVASDLQLRPHAPQSAPLVTDEWEGAPGADPEWVQGEYVQYAVGFANSAGHAMGPWSAWIQVKGAWPMVASIPTDPLQLAKTRPLYRQIGTKDAATGNITIDDMGMAVVLQDNTTTTYRDRPTGAAAPEQQAAVPFWHLSDSNGTEVWTASDAERAACVHSLGLGLRPDSACIFDTLQPQPAGTVPLYRVYNAGMNDHVYITSLSFRQQFLTQWGYTDEGIAGYVFDKSSPQPGTLAFHGFQDQKTSRHLFTTGDAVEIFGSTAGLTDDGPTCYLYASQAPATQSAAEAATVGA